MSHLLKCLILLHKKRFLTWINLLCTRKHSNNTNAKCWIEAYILKKRSGNPSQPFGTCPKLSKQLMRNSYFTKKILVKIWANYSKSTKLIQNGRNLLQSEWYYDFSSYYAFSGPFRVILNISKISDFMLVSYNYVGG